MDLGRGGADQAVLRRQADPQAARPVRARRDAALRPGQVVSGRTAAPLGLRALLARRRHAAVVRPRADRPGGPRGRQAPLARRGAGLHGQAVRQSRPARGRRPARVGGQRRLRGARGAAADQRGPDGQQAGRGRGTRPPCARLHPRAVEAVRLCAADPAGAGRRQPPQPAPETQVPLARPRNGRPAAARCS